jgi:hypothetical protein
VVDEEVSINGKEEEDLSPTENWESVSISRSASPIGNRSTSPGGINMFNENVFTSPTPQHEVEIQLSPEVHPLTDMNDITSSPVSVDDLRPVPSRNVSSEDGERSEELDERQLRQLALRRSTIKVPDASLAFPISENDAVGELPPRKNSHRLSTVGSLRPSVSSIGSNLRQSLGSPLPTPVARRSDISPFEEPSAPSSKAPEPKSKVSMTSMNPTYPDLGQLLGKFQFQRVSTTEASNPKMFGPEMLVEDPRVKALFEGVVRDILVVGAIAAVVWIALCLAVPCVGLV